MARSVSVRAAVLALGTGVLVTGLSACGASAGDDKHPDHRSFALHGRTLTVDTDNAAIELVAARGNKQGDKQASKQANEQGDKQGDKADAVRVTRWFDGSVAIGSGPTLSWSLDGDRLVLREHCSGLFADCSARYRVEVPSGIGVRVVDGSGDVRASGFTAALGIRTSNGDVHVTDSSGPLDLQSDNGAVRAEVTSRRVRAEDSNGAVDLELGAVPDTVDAHSDNGAVTVTLPRSEYHVTAESDNGAVSVGVSQRDRSPHRVTADSANGKVTVRNPN
ncbi:DUF4097 family beta strand repeat-containing protein [Streptomyces sp. NPDC007205]|uniref:DUF4097 family beta strand repeat-containing protein n=1 Tax=Streptomyces sp. NPDC007205 TaxID=3154316 RepID=UPI0033D0F354